MKVMVTGTTSLLGKTIVQQLIERGDDVVAVQRHHNEALDIEQRLGDIRDRMFLDKSMRDIDAVIHAAAKVGVLGTWREFREINVDGTLNALDAARRHGVQRFVHVSSPSVAHGGEPLVGAGATPAVLGRRRAFYAETKALAETEVLRCARPEMGLVITRPHLVWGPGDTQLVGRIIERARTGRLAVVGSGAALVDSTFIDNAAAAHLAALDAATHQTGRARASPTSSPTTSHAPSSSSSSGSAPRPACRPTSGASRTGSPCPSAAWSRGSGPVCGTTSHRSPASWPNSSALHTGSRPPRFVTSSTGRPRSAWTKASTAWPNTSSAHRLWRELIRRGQARTRRRPAQHWPLLY
jgi:2-alkyl-3-oxoalkanoate reductase